MLSESDFLKSFHLNVGLKIGGYVLNNTDIGMISDTGRVKKYLIKLEFIPLNSAQFNSLQFGLKGLLNKSRLVNDRYICYIDSNLTYYEDQYGNITVELFGHSEYQIYY